MNLCIPIDADRGLDSPICGHFGSAFYLADQGTVGAALSAWEAGALQRMQPAQACAGHGHPHP